MASTKAIRKTNGERLFDTFNIILLLGLVLITLYPLLYVLFASFSEPSELVRFRGLLFKPLGWSTAAYKAVFLNPNILTGYRNTLFYMVMGTTLNMVLTCLGAYALSRRNVLFKLPITLFILFTLFFNGGLIPTYLLVARTLSWIDTPWAVIVPTAISTWNLLVLKTAFEQVPQALKEPAVLAAAKVLTTFGVTFIRFSFPPSAVTDPYAIRVAPAVLPRSTSASKNRRGCGAAPGSAIARTTAPRSIASANVPKLEPRNDPVTSHMTIGLRRSGLSVP